MLSLDSFLVYLQENEHWNVESGIDHGQNSPGKVLNVISNKCDESNQCIKTTSPVAYYTTSPPPSHPFTPVALCTSPPPKPSKSAVLHTSSSQPS